MSGHSADLLLPRLRALRQIHYLVVLVMSIALLLVYYGFRSALPTEAGSFWNGFYRYFLFEYRYDLLGLLILLPALYSMVTLGWRRSLIIVAVLLAAIAPYVVGFASSLVELVINFSVLILPIALAVGAEMQLISNTKEQLARQEKERQRAEVIRQLMWAQEEERKRISQELHDGVAQTLLATAAVAHNLLDGGAVLEGATRAGLEMVKANSLDMVAEVRAMCLDLRPSILDILGLVSAIRWLAGNLREEAAVEVELSLIGEAGEFGPDESLALFRLVQEALNNVKKHARALSVRITLRFDDGLTTITVEDDGRGFENNDLSVFVSQGRLGLLGMEERARAIGGSLQVRSGKGLGTCVTVSVPHKKTVWTLDGHK